MANSNRVGPNPKKKPAEPATVSKKRERRPVSATSSITSLTVLRNRLQHLTRWIFIGLGVVLVLGFGLVSVPNMRTETQGTGDVAKVNRKVIEREPFEALVRQTLDSPYSFMSGPTQELAVRNMLLDQEVDRILKLDAARRERNKVGRQQLAERIDQAVESVIQQQKSYYKTEEAFKEKYLKKRMKVKDETELRQKIRKEISPDWVKATREQILIENLERKIRNQASSLPLDKAKPEEIEYRVRHILIKAENRSDAKAKQAAQAILDQLKAGADFVKLA
ncbi:MAG TPA: SurA N-terminal domain-containing protein, partial [Armatimonadota bacterium]|nr:SurA N-terminal domain-containing protein [Armatimonadota bacterium]